MARILLAEAPPEPRRWSWSSYYALVLYSRNYLPSIGLGSSLAASCIAEARIGAEDSLLPLSPSEAPTNSRTRVTTAVVTPWVTGLAPNVSSSRSMASLSLEFRAYVIPCSSASPEDAGKVRDARLAGQPSEPLRGALGAPPASTPWRARTPGAPSNRPSRFTSLSCGSHRFLYPLTNRTLPWPKGCPFANQRQCSSHLR
jgi:hypothetical protein